MNKELTLEELFKERLRAELATINVCRHEEPKVALDEYNLDFALSMNLSELQQAIHYGALAEYFLVLGEYELVKTYHKKYTKELKELL